MTKLKISITDTIKSEIVIDHVPTSACHNSHTLVAYLEKDYPEIAKTMQQTVDSSDIGEYQSSKRMIEFAISTGSTMQNTLHDLKKNIVNNESGEEFLSLLQKLADHMGIEPADTDKVAAPSDTTTKH